MNKKIKYLAFFSLLAIFFTGCRANSAARPEMNKTITVITAQNWRDFADTTMQKSLNALKDGNYKEFYENSANTSKLSKSEFAKASAMFNYKYGPVKKVDFLGCINKYQYKTYVWKAVFARTKTVEEKILKDKLDPKQIPETETLILLTVSNINGELKNVSFLIQ